MKLRLFLTCWIVFSLHFATNVVREHYPAFSLVEDGDFQRVEPADPDNSYLIQKLEGSASFGAQMPIGGPLNQETIDVIRQWITDGASM